ncbi:hypothetical protein Dda_3414 [Drechslerella dactyloides]|uniref:Uncharacterized protein n=1 Tax=Drechslerella dactyloides TaxID=74499 RepID=A0AAD6J191_DREDA|nr:hypothetical protein Dda_3414 [Drechslerella dactyloides]
MTSRIEIFTGEPGTTAAEFLEDVEAAALLYDITVGLLERLPPLPDRSEAKQIPLASRGTWVRIFRQHLAPNVKVGFWDALPQKVRYHPPTIRKRFLARYPDRPALRRKWMNERITAVAQARVNQGPKTLPEYLMTAMRLSATLPMINGRSSIRRWFGDCWLRRNKWIHHDTLFGMDSGIQNYIMGRSPYLAPKPKPPNEVK